MTEKRKGVPENSSVVMPRLTCRDPAAEIEFCEVVFVYLPDVDAALERAVGIGAQILRPAENQFWGDRVASIMDSAGHTWTIATRVEETTAEQRDDRWSDILKDQSEGD